MEAKPNELHSRQKLVTTLLLLNTLEWCHYFSTHKRVITVVNLQLKHFRQSTEASKICKERCLLKYVEKLRSKGWCVKRHSAYHYKSTIFTIPQKCPRVPWDTFYRRFLIDYIFFSS